MTYRIRATYTAMVEQLSLPKDISQALMKEALARVPKAQFCKEIARGYFRALTKAVFEFTIFNIFNHL